MIILIFEGIATSGKSRLIAELQEQLHGKNILVAGESETHLPIMHERDETHVDFFMELIDTLTAKQPDILFLDRFYLTQAFRAQSNLDVYTAVEDRLRACNAITIFLQVDESRIEQRIAKAALHRDPQWGEYLSSKGKTPKQIALTYINQQRSQLELLQQSTLPYKIHNTTNHDYAAYASVILQEIN